MIRHETRYLNIGCKRVNESSSPSELDQVCRAYTRLVARALRRGGPCPLAGRLISKRMNASVLRPRPGTDYLRKKIDVKVSLASHLLPDLQQHLLKLRSWIH